MCSKPKPQSLLSFGFMKFAFWIRDSLYPRRKVLMEVGIRPGFRILDYGCGTGSYVKDAAELTGAAGMVYALDVNPLSLEAVNRIAADNKLGNVKTILSGCATGLPDESMDVVLLYDIFHLLENQKDVLREVSRVLKPKGTLSFSDHHLSEKQISEDALLKERFVLLDKSRKTYRFGALDRNLFNEFK